MDTIRLSACAGTLVGLISMGAVQAQPLSAESCRPIVKRLLSSTPEENAQEFAKLDLDAQYTTYICAMQHVHPSFIELSIPFAAGGAAAAAYLQEKLMSAGDDETVLNISQVFIIMRIDRTYDVGGDAELMRLLEERLAGVGAESRELAQDSLEYLRREL